MRFSSASLLAMGFAFSVASAPMALAQSDQHDQHGGGAPAQHSAPAQQHNAVRSAPAQQRAPAQHQQTQTHTQTQRSSQSTQQRSTQQRSTDQRSNVQRGGDQRGGDQRGGEQRGRDEHGHWSNGGHFGGNRMIFGGWAGYNLREPPGGYEWVQDGNELLLINIYTGMIIQVFDIP